MSFAALHEFLLARTGHSAMADLSPPLGEERKSDFAFQAHPLVTDGALAWIAAGLPRARAGRALARRALTFLLLTLSPHPARHAGVGIWQGGLVALPTIRGERGADGRLTAPMRPDQRLRLVRIRPCRCIVTGRGASEPSDDMGKFYATGRGAGLRTVGATRRSAGGAPKLAPAH